MLNLHLGFFAAGAAFVHLGDHSVLAFDSHDPLHFGFAEHGIIEFAGVGDDVARLVKIAVHFSSVLLSFYLINCKK